MVPRPPPTGNRLTGYQLAVRLEMHQNRSMGHLSADQLEAAFNAALAARASSKQATSVQHDKDVALTLLLNQEAAYVQNICAGDQTKIDSSGFEVRNHPSPIGPLPAPASIELDANVNPGNMGVKWPSVPGAASYIVERALDGSGPLDYLAVATPTNTKVVVNTMLSGSRYWFRIAAVACWRRWKS